MKLSTPMRAAALAIVATLVLAISPAYAAGVTPPADGWLTYLNYYRATAGLPTVSEDAILDAGTRNHAAYMVANNTVSHTETLGNPYYTSDGALAGPNSVLFGGASTSGFASDYDAIDRLMQSPFHALGILDPANGTVGYGADRETMAFPHLNTAVAIDVRSGRGAVPATTTFPIKWPRGGSSVPLGRFPGFESPDPLAFCPGYAAPTGLPILFMTGTGATPPSITSVSLAKAGTPLEVCRLDQTNTTGLASALLAERNAVIIIPKAVLAPGTYDAAVTNAGKTSRWSFTVTTNRLATSLKTPNAANQPVVATFSEAVHGVTTSNFVVRQKGTTANVSATLTCRDAHGATTSCVTGSVATASLQPAVTTGTSYTVTLNPAEVTPVQSGGIPVPMTTAKLKLG